MSYAQLSNNFQDNYRKRFYFVYYHISNPNYVMLMNKLVKKKRNDIINSTWKSKDLYMHKKSTSMNNKTHMAPSVH
jgi:hypothetical protein